MKPSLRVVFLGQNNGFSLQCYNAVASRFEVVGIIESAPRQPSRTGGLTGIVRSLWTGDSLARSAVNQQVPYFKLSKGSQVQLEEFLRAVNPDVVCVASMSQLLPAEVLPIPKHGFVNLHPALLPDYRGPNPWWWQVYDQLHTGGVTVHQIDSGEDTGHILGQKTFPIDLGMAPHHFVNRAAHVGGQLMVEVLDSLSEGSLRPYPQPAPVNTRRARNLKAGEHLIKWDMWSIERTYHVMAAGAAWHDWRDPSDRFLRTLSWRVLSFSREECFQQPGTRHLDWRGWYIAHNEGKIRIAPRIPVRQLFRFLRT